MSDEPMGIIISRERLEDWAGRKLDDDDVIRIAEAVGESSVPEAFGVIADAVAPIYDADDRCRRCGEHFADPHDPDCENAR